MEYTQLGNSGIEVSRVGMGCWAIGGAMWGPQDDQQAIDGIKRAIDLGITFIDTAAVYGFGHSEELLSRALGDRRHDVVIATKFGVTWDKDANIGRDASPAHVVRALEGSLRRLRIDCIDLYQMHWPDLSTPIGETVDALLKCQQAGKVRYLGCSNFPLELVRSAQAHGRLDSLQVCYSLLEGDSAGVIQTCRREMGMGVLVYNVLAKGLLTGKFGTESTFAPDDSRSRDEDFRGARFHSNLTFVEHLKAMGRKYGKAPGQVAIRWVLDEAGVTSAIVGVKRPEQAEDNLGALGWSLSSDDCACLCKAAAG